MVESDILKKNFREYIEIAEYSFSKKKFNASVSLYYKALVELCDLELLAKTGRLGANHTERFSMLEKTSPSLYRTASRLFRYYRDSYNKEISHTVASLVKKEVEDAKKDVLE